MRTKSLGSEEDVASSQEAAQGQERRPFLKIPSKKTPWYLLSLHFSDGFRHWVDLPTGGRTSITCLGDSQQDKGWAPEACALCAYTAALYQKAKALGDERGAPFKKDAGNIRAKYEAHFQAIRGERIVKEDRNGKRVYVPDFNMDDDESEVEVGILSLSHSQFLQLVGMKDDDEMPHVKNGKDLVNRVLWSEKKKRKGRSGGGDYTEVKWTAAKKQTQCPEVEVSKEMDITEDFEVDEELVNKVYALLTGEESELVSEGEEVELEEDSPESEYDDDLDDAQDYEEADDEADLDKRDYLVDVGEDVEDVADDLDEDEDIDIEPEFEDDIPGEEEAPKPPRRKTTTKSSGSGQKKSGSTTAKTGKGTQKKSAQSGSGSKARMVQKRPVGRPPSAKTKKSAGSTQKKTSTGTKTGRAKSGKAKL